MSLPPFKNILGGQMVPSDLKYPQKSAIFAEERCRTTANALQVSISVVTALQTTSMKQIIHCKEEG